uniref:Transposase n=1 Tax=Heterorhabditis bacteriophora TaxID=37862 RepID=A0A1I7X2S1_HETBA
MSKGKNITLNQRAMIKVLLEQNLTQNKIFVSFEELEGPSCTCTRTLDMTIIVMYSLIVIVNKILFSPNFNITII